MSRLTNGMPFAQQFVHVSKGTDVQMPRKTKYIQHPTHPSQCVSFMKGINISFNMIKMLDAFKEGVILFIVKGHGYSKICGVNIYLIYDEKSE